MRVDGEQFSIAVPAIIDKGLFKEVPAIMQENQGLQRERRHSASYLLSGLVACGRCGSAYCASNEGADRDCFYYRCINTDTHKAKSGPVCQSSAINGDELDQLVWQEVCALLQEPARLRHELAAATKEVNGTSVEQATASFEAFSQAVASKLNNADATLKRELCKLLIERIEINDSDIHITYQVQPYPVCPKPR